MRPLVLVAVLSLAGLTALAATPTSAAFGWCTSPGIAGHECSQHLVCVGWSSGSGYERCQVSVREPCWYWNCYPEP